MKHIVLISCVKSKLSFPAPAERLYTSSLFKFSLAYARQLAPDVIYILSAKYGLVSLGQQVAPYEQTLKKMTAAERADWGRKVLRQLAEVANPSTDHFTILAGSAYADPLTPGLPNHSLPLTGLGQGRRLQFLKRNTSEPKAPPVLPAEVPQTCRATEPTRRSLWQKFLDGF